MEAAGISPGENETAGNEAYRAMRIAKARLEAEMRARAN